MKTRRFIVLCFIGVLIAFGVSDDTTVGTTATPTGGVTDGGDSSPTTPLNTGDSTSPSNPDSSSSVESETTVTNDATDSSVTQAIASTNVPGTVPTDITENPSSAGTVKASTQGGSNVPTTTAGPVCPDLGTTFVKADAPTDFDQTFEPGLTCSYIARTSDVSKSLAVEGGSTPITGKDAVLKISANGKVLYDSSTDPSLSVNTGTSQVQIDISTTTAQAEVKFTLSLDDAKCDGDDATNCSGHGTCTVIQGQNTCTCDPCYIGAKCEIEYDPCATYQLFCTTKSQKCVIKSGSSCEAECVTP